MSQQFNVAVLGASGAVGQAMIEILEERAFPVATLYPLASSRSAGDTVRFGGKNIEIKDVEEFDWSQVQIALFSAGAEVSAKWAPIAAEQGCIVIDNTSCFRYDEDIPLVIPEVNPEALADFRNRNIIANPNCSTIQMLVALKPLQDEVGIARINVATYQSVSGSGKEGVSELAGQTAQLLNGRPVEPTLYPQQIAFNLIPQIDSFTDNGYTREEMKMVWETQKILGDASIAVNPTCVRVPVFYGHAEAVHVELHQPLDAEQVACFQVIAIGGDARGNRVGQARGAAGHSGLSEGRVFFFLKKKEAKKTSLACTRAGDPARVQASKSFLVLFYKKEQLDWV